MATDAAASTPPDENGNNNDDNSDKNTLTLRVSLAAADPPLSLSLPPTSTISDLRAAIFEASPHLDPDKHRLRIIFAGKLLPPNTALASAGIKDNAYIHCAISDIAHASDTQQQKDCPVLLTQESGETRILLPAATQTVATLRAAGLSDEQIIAVRFPFLFEEGDGAEGLRIDLDELEMNEREADEQAEGPWNDCLWGFLLGALLGLIMLILSMDRSIVLSRRWKRGIGFGALVNIVFSVLMLTNDGPR